MLRRRARSVRRAEPLQPRSRLAQLPGWLPHSRSTSASTCRAARTCCSRSTSRAVHARAPENLIDAVRSDAAQRAHRLSPTSASTGDAVSASRCAIRPTCDAGASGSCASSIAPADSVDDGAGQAVTHPPTTSRDLREQRTPGDRRSRSRSCAAASTRPAPRSRRSSARAQDRILVQVPGVRRSGADQGAARQDREDDLPPGRRSTTVAEAARRGRRAAGHRAPARPTATSMPTASRRSIWCSAASWSAATT